LVFIGSQKAWAAFGSVRNWGHCVETAADDTGPVVGEVAVVGELAVVGEVAVVGELSVVGEVAVVGELSVVGEVAVVGELSVVGKAVVLGETSESRRIHGAMPRLLSIRCHVSDEPEHETRADCPPASFAVKLDRE
jgi:carbonic anhydrase/acetyltransferase-like protein (isoleucine patch superfamily)